MEKENKKVVRIKEIDGVPCINWSTARLIVNRNLVFEWKGQFFKVRHFEGAAWVACWNCRLDSICDKDVESICAAFDRNLGGCHVLELA